MYLRTCLLLIYFSTLFVDARVVSTSYGKLKGAVIESEDGNTKYMFKNIPFAEPPIGQLRFKRPILPKPWNGTRNATDYGPACLSVPNPKRKSRAMSEDCLHLNIFTNKKCLKNSNCPVIIYYHGGGFSLDSAIMFNDTFILERYVQQDIVFVIPAFRLGILGVFNLGDEHFVPQNLALYDCLHSLKFVHDQVSNFGGDPNNIHLMGHSTGASIVLLFGSSRLVDPEQRLFKKIIVLSAVHLFNRPELLLDNCYKAANILGCYSPNDTNSSKQDIIDCMKTLNSSQILDAQQLIENDNNYIRMLVPGPPFMESGETIKHFINSVVPRKMLMGTTIDENGYKLNTVENPALTGGFLDFENPYEIEEYFRKYQKDGNGTILEPVAQAILVSSALYSAAMVKSGGEVHLFQTNQQPNSSHVSDMQYFIGVHREATHTPDMDIVDSFYSEMIINFTKYGEPSPNWNSLDPSKMNYYAIEVDTKKGIWPKMEDNYREEDVNFWLINMSAYDREITKKKKSSQFKLSESTQIVPVVMMLEEYPLLDLINQWYFYAFIVLVGITLGFLIYFWPRKSGYTAIP